MRRRGLALVSQYLEGISRGAIEKYPEIVRQFARGRHGIYALFREDRLLYVGKASDLRNRLRNHLRDRHGEAWNRFSMYLTVDDRHLRDLEALIVRITRPRRNRQTVKFSKAQKLERDFRRMVQSAHAGELDELLGGEAGRGFGAQPLGSERKGRRPTLEKQAKERGPFRIRLRYKGRLYRARVRRDGSIRFKGQIFTSPSSAAQSVAKRAMDGWTVWKFERAPGDWVLLDDLR